MQTKSVDSSSLTGIAPFATQTIPVESQTRNADVYRRREKKEREEQRRKKLISTSLDV